MGLESKKNDAHLLSTKINITADPFYVEMDQFIGAEIQRVCTSLFCQLCDVKITSLSVERSHYSCKRHLEKVDSYRTKLVKKWATEKSQLNLYAMKAKSTEITDSKKSLQTVGSNQYANPKKTNSLGPSLANHCSVCNKSFNTERAFKEHMQMYPHQQLAKLESDLVKKEILKKYWTVNASGCVICTICDAKLLDRNAMQSHMKSVPHKKLFEIWCTADKTDELLDGKTCNTNLDEASEAKERYLTDVNISHAQNISATTKQDKNSSIGTAKKPSPYLPEWATNQVKEMDTNNSMLCIAKSTETKTEECRETLSPSKLKNEVFNELDRLVQKLYYSNTVPYAVSLEYLKRINKEVDEWVRKYDDGNQTASEKKPKPETNSQQIYSYGDFLKRKSNNSINETWGKDQYIDTVNVNSLRKILTNPNNEGASDDLKELVLPRACPNNATETNFEALKCKPKTSLTVKRSPVNDMLPNKLHKKASSISELLYEIQRKKHDVLTDSKGWRLEIEVLSEMEVLMLQIKNLQSSNIPLAEILKCLEKFNKEVDKPVGHDDGLPHDEKSDTASEVKEGNEHTNPPDREVARNSKGTSQAKINPGGHEVFYADEAAQSSGDKVKPEKNMLKESKLEETRPVRQDLPVEALELYETRGSLDFYSYYSGTNFKKFVDFRNVYLNGSMEELENWNAFRNNKRLLQEQ